MEAACGDLTAAAVRLPTEDGLASVSGGTARSCLLFLTGVDFFQSYFVKQPKDQSGVLPSERHDEFIICS